MYPNSIYFGLKVLPIQVHWGHSIYSLGTWTLRANHTHVLLPLHPQPCVALRALEILEGLGL